MGMLQRVSQAVRERMSGSPGARQVPLQPLAQAPAPPTSQTDGWFGPGDPPAPGAPASVAGRRLDFQPGVNMLQQPRQYESVTFAELRAIADGYDLLRLVIETRKDQISRLKWSIVPRDDTVKLDDDPELAARAKALTDLFRRPDREQFWGDWIRSVLEDLLVIDAPAVHVRRTRGGDVYSLDQIDGATVKRVVDDLGRSPEPPFCAYQQILKGLPAVNYSKQDLIYRPRNMRVHKLYGFSPVEQVVMTVNIALRRQLWQLAYFTDGNLPDSLIGVPSTWTPDQIKQFQDWFDSLLQGNLQGRRSARFVPGEVAKSYVPTKEAEIFGAAEEWLARVVCFCFGVSHQGLVKEVNRATAETAMEQSKLDGMAPVMNWIKGLHDSIILDHFNEQDLEFEWQDDKEMDPKVQSEIHQFQLGKVKTINECREELGLDPDPSELANVLGMFGADGTFTPLDPELQIRLKQQSVQAFTGMGLGPDGSAIPPETGPDDQSSAGVAATAGGEDGSGSAPEKLSSALLAKAKLPVTSPIRPAARRIRVRLQKKITKVLADVGDDVASQVEAKMDSLGMRKADEPVDDSNDQQQIDAIMASIDLSALDALIDVTESELFAMAVKTGKDVLAQLGVLDQSELVDRVNERAVEYARERSAELVGKRVLEDGSIIDNPNPKWAITETTRNMIRDTIAGGLADNTGSDAIIEALQEGYAFSPARAEMVSRTEIAMANSAAAMGSYSDAEEHGVQLMKEWILGPKPCDICIVNNAAGPIGLHALFPSGDETVPAHPNCECAVIGVVPKETGE